MYAQACFNGRRINDYCDPATSDCSNVRMFRWENHYYKDICSPTLSITPLTPEDMALDPVETPILGMSDPELDAEARQETCKVHTCVARTAWMHGTRTYPMRHGCIISFELSACLSSRTPVNL